VTRCLSDETLVRVLAELATEGERAHLATCASCGERQRRLLADVDTIVDVLATTPEPRVRPAPVTRRWVPVTALSAVALAAVIGLDVIVWKAIQPDPEPPQTRQMTAVLADVSAALFSLDGEPAQMIGEGLVSTLDPDDDSSPSCEGPGEPGEADCPEVASDLDEQSLGGTLEAMEADALDPEHLEIGG
jgi:hypothetical protein